VKSFGRAAGSRVQAASLPQIVQLLSGPEEPESDWRMAYGGTVDPESGRVELPAPVYAPCPFEACPDCAAERGK